MQILITIGGIMSLIGWVWAIINGFQKGGLLWGILNIIPVQPIIGVISAFMKKVSWIPVLIMVAGVICFVIGGGNSLLSKFMQN